MIPSDAQIAAVTECFPGIGRMQAIRHIQSRKVASEIAIRDRRARIVSTFEAANAKAERALTEADVILRDIREMIR